MITSTLQTILATTSPFDDAFDAEVFSCGAVLEAFPVWTHCGRRVDLQARMVGWQVLSLRGVVDDADANWNGHDDAAWDTAFELG